MRETQDDDTQNLLILNTTKAYRILAIDKPYMIFAYRFSQSSIWERC
jgi:hypothetical protein